jgi:2,4-didehydro-3-deoxy-L-rhamnonate hydrolase
MRLMRIGDLGSERPIVAVDDDTYIDVSDVVTDFNSTFFAAGFDLLAATVADRTELCGSRGRNRADTPG